MIGEVQILDVFAPVALVWAVVAGVAMVVLKALLRRSGLYAWVWYPGLFDLALFCCLWTGIGHLFHLFPISFPVSQ